jgi:uncharacterized protein YraI
MFGTIAANDHCPVMETRKEAAMIPRKQLACAAGFLLLSTSLAAAAPARVVTDLNVRSGEGTGYPVIAVMPAGAVVDVTGCGDGWCFVRDYDGFASASYLDIGSAAYVTPPPVVVSPRYYAWSYYDPPNYWAGDRFIRRGIREFRRELRQDRREDRREARREWRQQRREARRDDRREARREIRQERREARREARQERRENRRD